MSREFVDAVSPGVKLRNYISKKYPFLDNDPFLSSIDNALSEEGRLSRIVYDSCINYIIRRLVNTAQYIYRKNSTDSRVFVLELRKYVRTYTQICSGREDVDVLVDILEQCVHSANRAIGDGKKNEVRKNARELGLSCYICGKPLNHNDASSVEVEHCWPQALGGSGTEENLEAACSECNRNKKNHIDSSDFHYEHISFKTDLGDDNFWTEFEKKYRVAIYAKNEYKCMNCDQPASRVGKLLLTKRDPNDSWHFLNIECYCRDCLKRLQ